MWQRISSANTAPTCRTSPSSFPTSVPRSSSTSTWCAWPASPSGALPIPPSATCSANSPSGVWPTPSSWCASCTSRLRRRRASTRRWIISMAGDSCCWPISTTSTSNWQMPTRCWPTSPTCMRWTTAVSLLTNSARCCTVSSATSPKTTTASCANASSACGRS